MDHVRREQAGIESDAAPVVVLVHGAWHGAWCWDRLLPELTALGYDAVAVDLPGHEAPSGARDLHADADCVRERLRATGRPVLLVGHSYGGMVISDAGADDNVVGLVYLAAFLPAALQSFLEAGPLQPRPEGADQGLLLGCVRIADDGASIVVEGEDVAAALYGDCDEHTQRWALSQLGPQPLATFEQPTRHLAWQDKPTTYVVCTEDRALPAWHQRAMATHADRVVELGASHSPFLSMPAALAAVIDDAARA